MDGAIVVKMIALKADGLKRCETANEGSALNGCGRVGEMDDRDLRNGQGRGCCQGGDDELCGSGREVMSRRGANEVCMGW